MTTARRKTEPGPICPVIGGDDFLAIATGEEFETIARSGTANPLAPLRHRLACDLVTTPRARLAWLIDHLAYAKLDRRGPGELRRLWARLLIQVEAVMRGRWIVEGNIPEGERKMPRRVPSVRGRRGGPIRIVDQTTSPKGLRAAQGRVRRVLEDAADRKLIEAPAMTVGTIMGPDSKIYYLAPLEDAVTMTVLMLVEEISRERVRRCVYGGSAERDMACARVFVARKRQKYCDAHRADARREQLRQAQERHRRRTRTSRNLGRRSGRTVQRAARRHARERRGV